MYKNFTEKPRFHKRLRFLMRMSLIYIILNVWGIQFLMASHAKSQDLESIVVTVEMHAESLVDLFHKIEDQTNLKFVYGQFVTREHRVITFPADKRTVKSTLDMALQGTSLRYLQKNGNVVIYPEKVSAIQREEVRVIPMLQRLDRFHPQSVVTGKVTDENGEPLIGVNIQVKGTNQGTATDFDGAFTLEDVVDNAVLVVSYIGYQTQEILLEGQTDLSIVLISDSELLDEVVVVGYGTVKKSDLTGAVSVVSEDKLTAYPSLNALQSMQGRAAGVTIQSVNAEPGGDFKIRVRGQTSINANSNPLFVVDGLVGGAMPPPEDIASIEVLKDASATAIYGSRGANGVVMITTKSGGVGKITVSLNSYYSHQKEIGRLDLLNATEFAEYINEARGTEFYDLDNITTNTDWQDLIFQSGHVQNHQLSVSGGTEKYQFYVSGAYYDHVGVVKTSAFDRYSFTANLKFDVTDKLKIHLNSSLQSSVQDGVLTQVGGGAINQGIITAAHRFDPNQGILDENGVYTKSKVGIAAFENPMAQINGRQNEMRHQNQQLNIKAEYEILDGLTFNSTFGTIVRNNRGGVYDSRISNFGEQNMGIGTLNYGRNANFLTEQYLNYNFTPGGIGEFNLTGGYSYQKFNNESFSTSNAGFITDALGFWNLSVGTNLQIPNSNYVESEIVSFYGRLNYNYDSRFLITFTSRYDGASQFSEGNKWSFFPSGAVSWNIHNEGFWVENGFLTAAKLRASYGITGNQAIGAYESLARIAKSYFVVNETNVSAVRPSAIANKDLTWETTAQSNFGIDLGFWDRRINLSVDYYYKKTNDLLFSVPIPAFSGFQNRLENLGSILNSGFELQIDFQNDLEELHWNSSFNVTMNRNKVLALPGGVDILYAVSPTFSGQYQSSILREGEPVGSFYGHVYDGVDQEGDTYIPGGVFESEPGGEKYVDINEDGVLNNEDRQVIGNPNPKAVFGWNNQLAYKRFSFNIFLQAFTGGDMMNFVRFELDRLSGNTNATKDALNRWTPDNTDTDIPRAYAGRTPIVSTRFVENGSFLRLKNVSLNYEFDSRFLSRLKIASARLYLSGQNLLTLTEYSGVDPEVSYRNSNTNLGLDFGSYPAAISYTVGLNLMF